MVLPGGTVGGITGRHSHAPQPRVGRTYLMFVIEEKYQTFPDVAWISGLPVEVVPDIPDGGLLREIWEATCDTHPEGLFRVSPDDLVVPEHIRRRLSPRQAEALQ